MQYVQVGGGVRGFLTCPPARRRLQQAAYSRKPTAYYLARSASSPFVKRKGCLEDLATIPRSVPSLDSIEMSVIDGIRGSLTYWCDISLLGYEVIDRKLPVLMEGNWVSYRHLIRIPFISKVSDSVGATIVFLPQRILGIPQSTERSSFTTHISKVIPPHLLRLH
jgi:hypothetical protein